MLRERGAAIILCVLTCALRVLYVADKRVLFTALSCTTLSQAHSFSCNALRYISPFVASCKMLRLAELEFYTSYETIMFNSFFNSASSYDDALANAMASEQQPKDQPTTAPAARSATFATSLDIIHRRQQRNSPTPPKRQAKSRPAGPRDAVPADPNTSVSSSAPSAVSTVSDVGTAVSLSTSQPYRTVPSSSVLAEAAASPLAETAAVDSAHVKNSTLSTTDSSAQRRWSPAAATVLPVDRLAVSPGRHASKRDAAASAFKRWKAFLHWRAKWWSPFAVTLRGQVREAQAMLRQPQNSIGIAPASLVKQMEVWLSQLLQYMESPASVGKLTHLMQHIVQVRRGTPSAKAAVPVTSAEHAQQPALESAAPPPDTDIYQSSDIKRPQFKMLKRGDGLQRRGVQPSSVAVRNEPSVANANSVSVVSRDAPRATRSQGASSPTDNRSSNPSSARAAVPAVSEERLQLAKNIAAFLHHINGDVVKSSPLQSVAVTAETLNKRRWQLLETLFHSPDAASPDVSQVGGVRSYVPRFDARRHTHLLNVDDAPGGSASVFTLFRRKPHAMQQHVDRLLNDA